VSDPLVKVTVESSVLPAISTEAGGTSSGEPAGPPPSALAQAWGRFKDGARDAALRFIRPRITVETPVLAPKVFAPYGEPFSWPVGLAVLLVAFVLPLGFVGLFVFRWLARRGKV
jgi:hypothetical protein